jgi:N-ethylmaleimide reductase
MFSNNLSLNLIGVDLKILCQVNTESQAIQEGAGAQPMSVASAYARDVGERIGRIGYNQNNCAWCCAHDIRNDLAIDFGVPALQPDNMLPVAPSAVIPESKAFIENERAEDELVPFIRPRALNIEEMLYIVAQYERAARNAEAADFEGVEIHAANGYLIDQFIQTGTNWRNDAYGGPVENRARLLFEVAEALMPIWGPDRIGVSLSPLGKLNDISDENPEATFGYIAERLSDYEFAYLHIVNPALEQMQNGQEPDPRALNMVKTIRGKYKGTLIVAGGFQSDTAAKWVREGTADLIAFGRKFIANPDLPERIRLGAPFNVDDPTTYYGGGEKGYTDYPSLAQDRGEQPKACVDQRWR